MSRPRERLHPSLLALGLVALLGAGCGPVSSSGGGGGSPPARPPGQGVATRPPAAEPPGGDPGGGFQGGSGTGTALPPPRLPTGGGRSGTPGADRPPTSTLPPPTGVEAAVARIRETYGVSVLGPGATGPNVATIERALEEYQVGHAEGLESITVPVVHGLQSLQGLWQTRDGRRARITVWAQTGRADQVTLHTMAHELGHHMSLLSRRGWGDQFDRSLGTSSRAYPSSYSRTSDAEKMAENLAFSLLGDETDRPSLSAWDPPDRARDLMEQEFGARLELDRR